MTQSSIKIRSLVCVAGVLLATSLACRLGQEATPGPEAPSVTLTSPLPNQTAPAGEPIQVNSTSVDTEGIQRIELWVDDIKVRVDTNPELSSPYIVSQQWQSEVAGAHVIVVKAFNAQGIAGQSQPVVITLTAKAQPAPAATPVAQASSTSVVEGTPPVPTSTPPLPPTPTWTPTPASLSPTSTAGVTCTPPPCQTDEVYYCPDACPGGCGTQCATPTPTPTPPQFDPTGIETHDIFEPVWEQPGVKDYLGYPTQAASDDRNYARQYFDRGYLYWWDQPNARGLIWAIEMPQPAAKQGFLWTGPYEDMWDGGDVYSCEAAQSNPNGPVRGFGQLWCDHPEIAEAIGAARESEQGTGSTTSYGVVQFFQGGVMLYSPIDREVWALFNGGTWQRHPR